VILLLGCEMYWCIVRWHYGGILDGCVRWYCCWVVRRSDVSLGGTARFLDWWMC
jgi:hypothetical protein